MGFWDFLKTEEKEIEKETYEIKVVCLNCRNTGSVEIKKGIDVKTKLRDVACSECGLKHFAPYFINKILYEGVEGYKEIYDPIDCISFPQIPDKTINIYWEKDENKN